METVDLERFHDVPLELEAVIPCVRIRVRDLLALEIGSIVEADRLAGENVDVVAGSAPLGSGALTRLDGKTAVRMLSFQKEN